MLAATVGLVALLSWPSGLVVMQWPAGTDHRAALAGVRISSVIGELEVITCEGGLEVDDTELRCLTLHRQGHWSEPCPSGAYIHLRWDQVYSFHPSRALPPKPDCPWSY